LAICSGARIAGLGAANATPEAFFPAVSRNRNGDLAFPGGANLSPIETSVVENELPAKSFQSEEALQSRDPAVVSMSPMTETVRDSVPGIPHWKRLLDLSCIFLTSPCWLLAMTLVAIWVKATSAGPLFYCQPRVGYRGGSFIIFKFRSMRGNADTRSHEEYMGQLMKSDRPMVKLDNRGDNRLVPGGRFLRAAGLDELPQLINVVRGEMSLVGPRPCTPYEFGQYQACHRARLKAPPGLTGYWQVNGKNKTTFSEMVAMDVYYTENMSPALDLNIMFRTGKVIVAQLIESWRGLGKTARDDSRNPVM
jgi:lipopolysaccharide/colanic/teichoic acid biosynthesis glycosyltransferase